MVYSGTTLQAAEVYTMLDAITLPDLRSANPRVVSALVAAIREEVIDRPPDNWSCHIREQIPDLKKYAADRRLFEAPPATIAAHLAQALYVPPLVSAIPHYHASVFELSAAFHTLEAEMRTLLCPREKTEQPQEQLTLPRPLKNPFPFDVRVLSSSAAELAGFVDESKRKFFDHLGGRSILDILHSPNSLVATRSPRARFARDIIRSALEKLHPGLPVLFDRPTTLGLSAATCEKLSSAQVPECEVRAGTLSKVEPSRTVPVVSGWGVILMSKEQLFTNVTPNEIQALRTQFRGAGYRISAQS